MSCDVYVTVLAKGVDLDSFTMDFWKAMFGHDTVREKNYTEWRNEHSDPECVWAEYLRDFPSDNLLELSKKYPELKINAHYDYTGVSRGCASFYSGNVSNENDVWYPDEPCEDDFDSEEEYEEAMDDYYNFEAGELNGWEKWDKFDASECKE